MEKGADPCGGGFVIKGTIPSSFYTTKKKKKVTLP